jgi:hypothetical protein
MGGEVIAEAAADLATGTVWSLAMREMMDAGGPISRRSR